MSWSTEQSQQMVEQFWQDGVVRCPGDGGRLKLKLRKLHGGDYDLHAACPACGTGKQLRRGDDPRRHSFRPWRTDEIQRLTKSVVRMGASNCPVCATPIDWQTASGTLLLRCFRCGNSNQWQQVAMQDESAFSRNLLDLQPSLTLLDLHDKQSLGQLVGPTVETGRRHSAENPSPPEATGSNRQHPSECDEKHFPEEEASAERSKQSENFQGS